jgi:cell division protein FtsB
LLLATLVVCVALGGVFGDSGFIARAKLMRRLEAQNAEVMEVERANQRLLRANAALESDPIELERAIADELGWGSPGDRLIRFPSPTPEQRPGAAAPAGGLAP